jgi:hypothetical protein
MTALGVRFGAFTVMSLMAASAAHSAEPRAGTWRRVGQAGQRVSYAGTVVLSGTYERRLDPTTRELLGEQVCFVPDAASKGLVPREEGDMRLPWFCFSNRDRAALLLSLPTKGGCGHFGTATVVVSHYVADRAEATVFDTAQLDRVLTASRPEPLACPEE